MSPAGMAAMRMAATLAHALPSLRLRIRHRDTDLVEVAHPAEAAGPAIGACAFRRAVTCAHEQSKAGVRLSFMGLAADEEPAIDIGVRAGDAALPGGIVRVAVGDSTVHGFATMLPARHCRDVLRRLPDTGHVVRLHHDAATEVTFVHTVTPTADALPDGAHLAAALEALLADEVVLELVGNH